MDKNFIIAIDFDGTIVQHRFPRIGPPVPGAIDWLKRFQLEGAKLILWTIRCHDGSMGDVLSDAVNYCHARGVNFWGVNKNPTQTETRWSTSQKVYAHAYIDDCAAGTPLIRPANGLPYVDWSIVGPHVVAAMKQIEAIAKMKIEPRDDGQFYGVATPPQLELPEPKLIEL